MSSYLLFSFISPPVKKSKTLRDLLLQKLMALYDVELRIIKALPGMAKKASDPELRAAFTSHLQETYGQVERLEHCFKLLKTKPKKLPAQAIRGLAEDTDWVVKHVAKGPALDANLIAAAQYVEHYEIAGYGTAREWASLMGHADVADLLHQTLSEEVMADETLSDLAEAKINNAVEMGVA